MRGVSAVLLGSENKTGGVTLRLACGNYCGSRLNSTHDQTGLPLYEKSQVMAPRQEKRWVQSRSCLPG